MFNFSWNQAANVGWPMVYNHVLLIVGILFLVAFVWIELKVGQQPLVPIKALSGESILALAVIAAGWGSFGIWVYHLWNFLEVLRGYSALAACAQNAPVAISGLLASVATGILLSKTKVSNVLLLATLFFLIGQILIATAPPTQIYWAQTFVSIIIMPWGMDMSFPSGTIILSNSTAKEHQGVAASLVNTVVNYSISIVLRIAGTVDRNVNKGGKDVLGGYRGAWYFGIGLDVVAIFLVIKGVFMMFETTLFA
ncbi:hypothetical protein D6C79_04861 [Aureobasidium pullulans]|nr:hypothetical protein D6C79_04861 [Aureobasidium pullulans]